MKTLIISFAAILLFSFAGHAQNRADSTLTWNELKTVQQTERSELKQTQENEFRQLIEMQKAQIAATITANAHMGDLSKLLAEERNAAMKHYSDERKRLAELQSQERIAFKQRTP